MIHTTKWIVLWTAMVAMTGITGCVHYKDQPLSAQDQLDNYRILMERQA